jgi:phytoene synthase
LRKLGLTARALVPPRVNRAHLCAEPLPQVRYLIRAVDSQALPEDRETAPKGLSGDIEWVLDVFAELERRDHLQHRPVLHAQSKNGAGAL